MLVRFAKEDSCAKIVTIVAVMLLQKASSIVDAWPLYFEIFDNNVPSKFEWYRRSSSNVEKYRSLSFRNELGVK